MKRWMFAALLTLFACQTAFGGQATAGKRLAKSPPSKSAPAKSVQASEPKLPYEAYAVADAESGAVIEGLNMHLKWYQASLTKLMLACVVMDQDRTRRIAPHGSRHGLEKRAEGMGGTQCLLKAGETFTLEELMQAALIESANDAAYAIAEHAAGSSEAFVEIMNRKAHALGMDDTAYYGVHGLPAAAGSDNITTCNDMIRLAREALRHPKVLEWTSTEHTTFRSGTLVHHQQEQTGGAAACRGRPQDRLHPQGGLQHRGDGRQRRAAADRGGVGQPRVEDPGPVRRGKVQGISYQLNRAAQAAAEGSARPAAAQGRSGFSA
jgi:serine-type D-Ala-D-Ala carboxypeptidase (penicillin-binding protein 5/6)